MLERRLPLKYANADTQKKIITSTTNPKQSVLKWKMIRGAVVTAFALSPALSTFLQGAVNVSFSNTAPASLQTEFLSGVTTQYVGVVTKSPFFSNTYSFVISGKNEEYQPPPAPPVVTIISTGTYVVKIGEDTKMVYQSTSSISEIYVYGFADGMESERKDDLSLIRGLIDNSMATDTCGGFVSLSTSTAKEYMSGCYTGYNTAISTISVRDGMTPQRIIINVR